MTIRDIFNYIKSVNTSWAIDVIFVFFECSHFCIAWAFVKFVFVPWTLWHLHTLYMFLVFSFLGNSDRAIWMPGVLWEEKPLTAGQCPFLCEKQKMHIKLSAVICMSPHRALKLPWYSVKFKTNYISQLWRPWPMMLCMFLVLIILMIEDMKFEQNH